MNAILLVAEIVSAVGVVIGTISGFVLWMRRLVEGQKCQLRSEMLRTYYKHKDDGIIRQYEFENFLLLYKAYKSLKGNSFIDKIHDEVIEWEVES
jgi:hypothetical protein